MQESTEITEEIITQTEQEDEIRPKYKRKRVMIPLILGILGIISGVHYYVQAITYVSTDDAYVEGHSVQISSKVSGNIVKILVDDNQNVKKGQLLMEIDPTDYQVKYEQALAKLEAAEQKQLTANVNVDLTSITSKSAQEQADSAVEMAKSAIEVATKQIKQAQASLSQSENEIISVKAEFDLAENDFNRYKKLYKQGVVSKQDMDRIFTTYKAAKSNLDSSLQRRNSAEAALHSAYSNKKSAEDSLRMAQGKFRGANTVNQQVAMSDSQKKASLAELKLLKATAKQAKLELSYTKIYAPQAGMVTGKSITEGTYIQTGQSLFAIVPEKRWIVANFKETQLTNMKVGQPVNIKIDAYPSKVFKGQIDSIQSSTGAKTSMFPPENAVGSFVKVVQRVPVKITFTEGLDSTYAIVPGMSVIPEVKVK